MIVIYDCGKNEENGGDLEMGMIENIKVGKC